MPEDRDRTTVQQGVQDEQVDPDHVDGDHVDGDHVDGAANPVTPAQGPGQAGSDAVLPVPAPGASDSSAGPGVRTAQGASPEDGVHAGEKSPGSDASVSSPGAWTALAAPGAPDGEVDTRA